MCKKKMKSNVGSRKQRWEEVRSVDDIREEAAARSGRVFGAMLKTLGVTLIKRRNLFKYFEGTFA